MSVVIFERASGDLMKVVSMLPRLRIAKLFFFEKRGSNDFCDEWPGRMKIDKTRDVTKL